ncbi:MAG: 4Fe-4S binding protein [Dehalococcoidales bacterium]|nr:4Fe-4S binding protein [Dehalococcoidales bacterium]
MGIKFGNSKQEILSTGRVVPDTARCVQCGICSFNCPAGIDVRQHVWEGRPINDSHCLTCGQCITRCPRGVLRFERLPIMDKEA